MFAIEAGVVVRLEVMSFLVGEGFVVCFGLVVERSDLKLANGRGRLLLKIFPLRGRQSKLLV
jgi:hypothetical protein